MSRRADLLLRFVVIFSVVFVHVRSSVNSSSSPWNSVRLLPPMDDFGLASLFKQCITGAVMHPLSNYCFSSTKHFVLKHNFSIGLFTSKKPTFLLSSACLFLVPVTKPCVQLKSWKTHSISTVTFLNAGLLQY